MYRLLDGVELILASTSPRRRELLADLRIPFRIEAPAVIEDVEAGEEAKALVERLSLMKAQEVAARFPSAWVIGADTTVVLTSTILNKPNTTAEACEMLSLLQGRTHKVWTGCALIGPKQKMVRSNCTQVTMRQLTKHEMAAYVESKEPLDKAGSYAIQGLGSSIIKQIDGSYTNVVGLDIVLLVEMAKECGILETCR